MQYLCTLTQGDAPHLLRIGAHEAITALLDPERHQSKC